MASFRMLIRRRSSAVSQYIETMKNAGVSTTKGDVKTIRSQLHARRAELNEEIEREDRMMIGSKKLLGASTDVKAKNQAALEKSFSESKIKALQSELSKINSSLSAYQADGCDTTQVPLIPVALKITHKINFEPVFREIIKAHYHTDPLLLEDCIQEFQLLRDAVSTVSRDSEGLRTLYEYHSHLQLASKRLVHRSFKHGLMFTWYDAINGLPYQQQTVVFERACVLFNIAALYSQLAANVDRDSTEGITEAVDLLEKALGMFEYIRDKFANAPSRDLSQDMLSMLGDLMRAQAQELLCEKNEVLLSLDTLEDHIDHAHRTKCVADCYSPVREFMEKSDSKEYIPECWLALVKIKEAHYKALAHYHAGCAHGLVIEMIVQGGSVPENIRTELHFLYIESPPELNTNLASIHIGLMQSHLSSSHLFHEFAIKFNSLCRDLQHITPLTKILSGAAQMTNMKKAEADKLDGTTVIFPSLQASAVGVRSQVPKPSSFKVEDFFHSLGPLPCFSGDNRWSPKRKVTITRQSQKGMGILLRNSSPVVISTVEEGGSAQVAGIKNGDWIVSVGGIDVLYHTHEQVIELIKNEGNTISFELITPK